MTQLFGDQLGSILLTLASLLATFLIAYAFYAIQRRQSRSAETERVDRAQRELTEIFEHAVVNKRPLNQKLIENLITASEREYGVSLRASCTAHTLAQDVLLRLQRSPHLDQAQKGEYQRAIEDLLQTFDPTVGDHSRSEVASLLERSREAMQLQNTDDALEAIDQAQEKLKSLYADPSTQFTRPSRSDLIKAGLAVIAGLYFIIRTFILLRTSDIFLYFSHGFAAAIVFAFAASDLIVLWQRRYRDS